MALPLIAASVAGGMNFVGSMLSNSQNTAYNRALSDAYRAQVRLGYIKTAQENRYLNEELGQQIENLQEYESKMIGSQYAAWAGSGFYDMSTGDKRLVAETARKSDALATNANREAYLQAFEMFRQANLNAIYLNAQANMADIAAKSTSGWRGFTSALTSAGLSALGAYAQFAQPSGKAKNVDVAAGRGYQSGYSAYEANGRTFTDVGKASIQRMLYGGE